MSFPFFLPRVEKPQYSGSSLPLIRPPLALKHPALVHAQQFPAFASRGSPALLNFLHPYLPLGPGFALMQAAYFLLLS